MSSQSVRPALAASQPRFAERFLAAVGGAFSTIAAYIGDRLGFYEALAAHGPMTSAELARRTHAHERYVREWLEQQTVTGFVAVHNPEAATDSRRYHLPEEHRDALVNADSLDYMPPLAQMFGGAAQALPDVVEAFRTGAGVPYWRYGDDFHRGQARMNRAMFLQQLGPEWLASIADVHERLGSEPPARVADIGCGHGWSSIGIALSYRATYVDGFDSDRASVEQARANAAQSGVAGRVLFSVTDVSQAALLGRYDLVIALECVHDMADPVGALKNMRKLACSTGAVIVVDERVGHSFTPQGVDLEWLMYGFSVLHCLPVGMAEQPSAGTGAVMRPATLKEYALAAGFKTVEILPIEHALFRFYRLHA